MPIFRDIRLTKWTAENTLPTAKGVTVQAFLLKAHAQSGFKEGIRRIQSDHQSESRP
jgi:hypothetical protein